MPRENGGLSHQPAVPLKRWGIRLQQVRVIVGGDCERQIDPQKKGAGLSGQLMKLWSGFIIIANPYTYSLDYAIRAIGVSHTSLQR